MKYYFLLSTFLVISLSFTACTKKPDNPVAVDESMFPPAPQNILAKIEDEKIIISWHMPDPSNISEYLIFRGDSLNLEFQLIDTSFSQTYIDNFLYNDLEYFYQISAINLSGFIGPRSNPIRACPGYYNIIINGGELFTDSLSVSLTLIAPSNVSLVKISDDSFFKDSTWESYISPRRWRLNGIDGPKSVYVKFRDELGNETAKPVFDSIILDTKAYISSVTENTNGEVKTIGDTIHFTLVGNELYGYASIDIGEVIEGITVYDDGTNGDSVPDDGRYEVDYVINQNFTATNASVIGNFIDQVGNVALPATAAGQITILHFPDPVTLFNPIIDGSKIYLTWSQNNNNNFSSYRIYRSEKSNIDANDSTPIAVITDRITNYYQDEGLKYSTSYYYRIYVHDVSGQNIASNEVVGTTEPNGVPVSVILAIPSLVSDHTFRLSWTQNNDDDFASYRIFRSESSPVVTTATPIMIINSQLATTYDDLNLVGETEYFYKIFVYDYGELSAGSEEVSGKTNP